MDRRELRIYTTNKFGKHIIVSWMQPRCEKCNKFLSKEQSRHKTKLCSKCSIESAIERHRKYKRDYKKTSKGRITQYKGKARRRGLGTEILVHRPTPNNIVMEGHHITRDYIIPIPKELHQSVWHDVRTGKGMNEINLKVYEWLNMNSI